MKLQMFTSMVTNSLNHHRNIFGKGEVDTFWGTLKPCATSSQLCPWQSQTSCPEDCSSWKATHPTAAIVLHMLNAWRLLLSCSIRRSTDGALSFPPKMRGKGRSSHYTELSLPAVSRVHLSMKHLAALYVFRAMRSLFPSDLESSREATKRKVERDKNHTMNF